MFYDFTKSYNVDYSKNLIDSTSISEYEKLLGVSFGEQLVEYLTKFGYLGCGYIELYGINSKQLAQSDMVMKTLNLHKNFSKTQPFVAIEDQGDGDFYLVDENDYIFRFVPANDELSATGLKLADYILNRLKDL